jgi:acid phosphatase
MSPATVAVLPTLALAFALGVRAGWWACRKLVRKGAFNLREDICTIHITPKEPGVLSFIALGDVGTGDADQQAVAATVRRVCAERRCDFMLFLGDNFYNHGVSSIHDPKWQTHFEALYSAAGIPVLPVLGNHDVKKDALAQVLYSMRSATWRMPNFQYAFHAGPARFFALNTNLNLLAWMGLRRRLRPDPSRWTFVFAHHALYGSGAQGDMDAVGRWYWQRYLRRQVDFYVAAHNHQLQHLRLPGQTTDYIVSGAGGSHYRDKVVADERFKPTVGQSLFLHRDTGLVWFRVTADHVRMELLDGMGRVLYGALRRRDGTLEPISTPSATAAG